MTNNPDLLELLLNSKSPAVAVIIAIWFLIWISEKIINFYKAIKQIHNREQFKREADQHLETMSRYMTILAENQKQTADAVHDMADTVHQVKRDTSVLIDRRTG